MSAAPIRLGIVGCGHAVRNLHLRALAGVPALTVTALCDVDDAALSRAAALSSAPKRFTDFRDLINDRDVHAIAVCTPPQRHADIALAALDTGKPLFIEKPLALNVPDCDRLVERAGISGSLVQVGFNLRQHRLVHEARTLLAAGHIGPPALVRSIFTGPTRLVQAVPAWRDDIGPGADVLFEIAVHHFDLWRFLLETEVVEVYCAHHGQPGKGTSVITSTRMENGVLIDAVFSDHSTARNELELFGNAGRLCIDLHRFDGLESMRATRNAGDLSWRARKFLDSVASLPAALRAHRVGGDYFASYRNAWQRFADAVANGAGAVATLADGRKATLIADAARRSVNVKQPVSL